MADTLIKFVQIEDSPKDGLQYARQSGSWTKVTGSVGGGGIPDAPFSGFTYGRNSGTWVIVSGTAGGGIAEAPLDGFVYGRASGSWVKASGTVLTPASSVASETSFGLSTAIGSSLLYARQDHSHGSPPSGVLEAPFDGLQYGRQSGSWTKVTGSISGGLPDAPLDGLLYGRQSGTWKQITGSGGTFPPTGSFLNLTDTPDSYAGAGGYFVSVSGSALIFTSGSLYPHTHPYVSGTFLSLTDTPKTYTGFQNYYLSVSGTGVVFTTGVFSHVHAYLTDAPIDANIYGRRSGTWIINTGTGIGDAPFDTKVYGRLSGTWVQVSGTGGGGGLPEAPMSGYTYGRNSGTWVQISGTSTATTPSNRSWFGV